MTAIFGLQRVQLLVNGQFAGWVSEFNIRLGPPGGYESIELKMTDLMTHIPNAQDLLANVKLYKLFNLFDGMTPKEQNFFRAACDKPDADFWCVLADWLEEQKRDVEARRVRALELLGSD